MGVVVVVLVIAVAVIGDVLVYVVNRFFSVWMSIMHLLLLDSIFVDEALFY